MFIVKGKTSRSLNGIDPVAASYTTLCPSTTPSGLQSVSSILSAREPLAVTSVRPLDITITGPSLADDPEMLLGLINAGNVEVYSLDEEETVGFLVFRNSCYFSTTSTC